MQIFLFNAGVDPNQLKDLERRVRLKLPDLQLVSHMEEITKALPKTAGGDTELACILFPVVLNAPESFDRMVSIATEFRDRLFFIFISDDDIPASDYKRLVQTGGADWASTRGAPEEIVDIIARIDRGGGTADVAEPTVTEPVMVAFLPSAGGVGNSTLAIEVGIQIKTAKRTRGRRVCLLDLDFQNSHVCDYLDIEPRLQIHEIATNPERLDAQLFDLFVSHHGSGLDVLAAPRKKDNPPDLDPRTLEVLFQMIATRYDLILLDLPVPWFNWTRQLLSAAEVVLVSGLNTIPGLRQVVESLAAVRAVDRLPPKIAVVLNRCEHRLLGGFARRNHVKNLLGSEEVFFVREDTENAVQAVNTGIPMAVQGQGKMSKDIAPLALLASEAKPVPAAVSRP
ncbi:pilus assembly protein CpaE [Bradyrhizobium sp. GM24.11]